MRQSTGSSRPVPQSASTLDPTRIARLWPRARQVEPLRFRQAPLLAAALAFSLGESIPRLAPAASRPTLLLAFASAALAALTILALRRSLRITLAPALALWIAAGLWSAQLQPSPPPQTVLLSYADGLSRTVTARIVRIRQLPHRTEPASDTTPDIDSDQWDEPGQPTLSLDLALNTIEDVSPDTTRIVPIAGGIRATLLATGSAAPALRCGDLISAPVRLRVPDRYRDPGAWQYADYLLDPGTMPGSSQGIAATTNLPAAKLRLLHAPPDHTTATLQCRIQAAQAWAAARLLAFTRSRPNRLLPALLRLSPEDAGMLNAMLFGDRSRLTHSLRLGFERTGSFHLFVVSGMHVALLAGALLILARRLRLRDSLATILTLALTTAYALLTGFGVPVQRALLMTAVFLLTRLLSRSPNSLNALGAAALAVLVWSPRSLFEASFQMTFLVIVAIAGIAIPLGERSFLPYAHAARDLHLRWKDSAALPRLAQFRLMLRLWSSALAVAFSPLAGRVPAALIRTTLWAAELALIGLIAEAVMVLPMALYFHRATVFALPANMLSIPLVGLLAPLAVTTFCCAILSPWLAAIPAAATALLLHAITAAISLTSRAPSADLRLPGPTLLVSLIAAACFALCCWLVRRPRAYAFSALAILPLTIALIFWPASPTLHSGELEVTAIDVGQGDSLLVVSPSGRTMLIDAGGPTGAAANSENAAANSASFDIGEDVVSPYLWSRHIRTLDLVVLTHAHSDHMGGMPAILRNFHPRALAVSVDSSAPAFHALLDEAAALHIPVLHLHAGDTLPFASPGEAPAEPTTISVLAPDRTYTNPGRPSNNDSLVLRIQYGLASALLEGDAEAPSERSMVARSMTTSSITAPTAANSSAQLGPDTLLKVAHHGSRTSTLPDLLALAAPQAAIISVGRHNTFGHPRPEIIARLAAAHTHLYRTDEFGLTTFLLTHDGRISALTSASNP